ncbi:ABC1 kinase family protein [Aeromicrobium massiliense]|uniref:ABC1 kinase family protein n=1 Tax=Aeromicrobium massiliense TaxID=1464554 RepID=UPI0002DFF823|nr:AarF/ABC1/UbiB kinase family protein [Aeromicrobium massiliense]
MAKDEEDRGIRGNALSRGARLAALPVGFAGRTTWGLGKRLVGAPAGYVATEVQQRTADQIFRVLGELKGGAMKLGQAMSIFEAALPPEIAGPYRETLTKLQDAAPPMPTSTVHRVLAEQLGPDWRDLLTTFDDKPAASASIGQVHRGTWHDGREVAVKIQYPGAGRALRSDLRQIARIARLFGVLMPGMDVRALVTELQERVAEELDYALEAAAQQAFADELRDDPEVVVPNVVHHTDALLVSEWLESASSLAEVIVSSTPEERDRYGEAFIRFLLAGPERVGLLHADPHPGNFRIMPDGRLGVVDFGAVARLPDGLPPSMGRLLRLALDGDRAAVLEGLRAEGFVRVGVVVDAEQLGAYLDPFLEPVRHETFPFDRDWLRGQAGRLSQPSSAAIASKINLPPEYLLIHRVWAGGIGVLCQLGATVPARAIVEESVPGFAEPPGP